MSMQVPIVINGVNTVVSLRKIKTKELKHLALKLSEKLDQFAALASSPDFTKTLPAFISDNIDFICLELVLPFTDLSSTLLDETDVPDIVSIIAQLLSLNGIDLSKLKNFFRRSPVNSHAAPETFTGVSVPSAT